MVCGAFCKTETSNESAKTALRKLQNKISSTAKYVNKDEKNKCNDNFSIPCENIISDGIYVIYRIKNVNETSFVYFQSENDAINAVKKDAYLNNSNENILYKTYIYKYLSSDGSIVPIMVYDNRIFDAIEKIKEIEIKKIKKN